MTSLRRHSAYLIVLVAGPVVPIALSVAGLIVARTLSPSLYGRVAYFFSSFNLITILWQLGLGPLTTGEVARSISTGGIAAGFRVTPPYLIARVASVAALIPLSIAAALLGDSVIAVAAVACGVALLAAFAQALAQGLGRASLVASVQIGQALLYLAIVLFWARDEPDRVFLAVIATYAISLFIVGWASRSLVPSVKAWWSLSRGRWQAVGHMLGWLYAIALLQTPYGSLAVLALGRAGRFEDAAVFSLSFTIPLLLSVSAATVIGIQYYPRLCQLLTDAGSDVRTHFDSLYRLLAWMGLSAAVILLVHPVAIISFLFTAAYINAAGPMASLSIAAGVLPIAQLGLWTLIAHNLRSWALAGAAAQLAVILPFVAVALLVPQTPLWVLGGGHSLSAVAALALAVLGLRREGAMYDWRPRRLALASLAALATAVAIPGPEGSTAGVATLAPLVAMCAGVCLVSGLVLWSPEATSTFARIHRGWRSTAAANRSDAQSADIGIE